MIFTLLTIGAAAATPCAAPLDPVEARKTIMDNLRRDPAEGVAVMESDATLEVGPAHLQVASTPVARPLMFIGGTALALAGVSALFLGLGAETKAATAMGNQDVGRYETYDKRARRLGYSGLVVSGVGVSMMFGGALLPKKRE